MIKCCGVPLYDKRKKRCRRLKSPYLLDLVSDRVKSRLLTITIFLSVFTFAGYTLFWEVMHRPTNLATAPYKPTKITVLKSPSSQATVGVPFTTQPSVQVYGQDGTMGVQGVEVIAKAYYYDPSLTKRFEGASLDDVLSPDYIEANVSLSTMNQLKIYQPILSGDTVAYSNEEGIVNFDNLSFVAGYPGINTIYFESEGILSATEVLVTLKGSVSSIEFSSNPPQNISMDETTQVQSIYATIKDTVGEPLSGKFMTLFALNDLDIFGDFMNQRFYWMSTHILGPSDEDGIINVDLNITGTNTKTLFFQVACEGNLLNWVYSENNIYQPTKVISNVESVLILQQPSPNIIFENETFSIQPVVQVLDSNGTGIAGKRVFAMISTQLDSTLPYFISDLSDQETKSLINPISSETDSDGKATFQNLAFSIDGKTNENKSFAISFVCDGISSDPTNDITVKSKVDHLEVLGNSFNFSDLFNTDEEWPPGAQFIGQVGLMNPSLQIRVLDSDGNGVSGKVPHFRTVNINDTNDSLIVIQTIDTVSDLDGIFSTQVLGRSGPNGTTYFRIEVTIDDVPHILNFTFNLTVFAWNATTSDQTSCRIVEILTEIPTSIESGTDIGPITVQIFDFARRPVSGNDMYILLTTPANVLLTYFPYWFDSATTDSTGTAVISSLIIEGYNITGTFAISAAYDRYYECYSNEIKIDIRTPVTQMELLQAPQQSYATEYFKHSNFELKALDKYGNPVSGKTAVFYLYSYPTYVAQEILDAFLTWGSESVQVNNAITNGRQFFGIQTESTTDSNGIVTFENFYIYEPGNYSYFFTVDGIFMNGFENYNTLEILTIAEYLLVIQNASSSTITLNEPWDYVPQLVLLDSKYNEIDLQRVKLKTYIEGLNEDEYIITFDCGDEHTSESPTNDCYSYSYTSSSVMYFYNFQIIEFSSPNPCFQIYFVFAEGEPYELYSGLSEVYCIENYITSVTALSDVSAYTTVDTYTQSASILQTETLLGTAIQGLEPNVDVVDKPPGFADCTFQWQYFATDSLGQSYLWIELFDGCVTGRYSFIASLGGVNASTLFYIDLTDQAKYIEIVQYENNTSVDAIVGEFIPQSFEVVVKIYTLAALNGKSVTAFISGYNNSSSENVCSDEATVPDYTNVTLDAYHATEITTSNQFLLLFQYYGTESSVGTAVFNLLKFTSGKSGFYCVKFKVEDIVTSSGIVMNVINNVTEVAIVKQPSNKVKTGHRFDQQPLIKIYDNGIGLANRSITVGFYHECIGASITYNDNPITDSNGEYQFWDLTISGTGGTCQLVFISQGIASDPSSKFNIIGLSEPSFQYIGKWKSIIALTVLAFVPLFFFNEANTSTWFLVVGLLACAIPEFFGYVALEKLSFQQNQDGENSYLRLITSMFIICINILVILFAWNMVEGFMKKKNWQFYDKKKLASQKFVKYLLQKNEDMVFSAELPDVDLYDSPNESNSEIELDNFGNKVKKEKEYITHKKTIEIKNEVMDSFSDMMLSSRNRFISWIMPKQKTAHSKFEPSFSFFYPQRLILAACLTILLLIYFLAGAFLLVEWFVFYLKKWREDILGYQSRIDYIIALINESILETVTQSSSLNPAKINYIPDSIETIFKASQTQVDRLISIVKFSGRFTGIMLFLIFLFVWWLIFRLYRRRIMWLRQGVRFTKRKPNTGKATSFPGLTAATFIYGFVALWVITTAIIIVLLFFPFFNVLWFVFRWIFYTFMIGFFVMKMWEFFLLLFINRNSVTKLRCFSTAEFIWTFLNFVYGVAFASARIFRVLYFTLFHFIRVDLDTLHNISFLKRAYRSYVGMIYMDHIHNNPIRLCFGNMLERKNLKKSIAKLDLANKSSDFSPEFPNDKPKNNQDFVEEKQDLILQQKVKSRFLFLITISRNKNLINSRQRNLQISQKN